MPERIAVVGVVGGEPVGKEARAAIEAAAVVAGAPRHLRTLAPLGARTLPIDGPLSDVLDALGRERGGVCVLGSGDPGFFGIVRVLAERFAPQRLDVHPAPSSVSLAFARLGLPWDDAAVISAHGRPLAEAARRAVRHSKAAVLVAPDAPPEALGRELFEGEDVDAFVGLPQTRAHGGPAVRRTERAQFPAQRLGRRIRAYEHRGF